MCLWQSSGMPAMLPRDRMALCRGMGCSGERGARGATTFWTEKEVVVRLPLEKNANVLLQMPTSMSVSQWSSVCSVDQMLHQGDLTWHQALVHSCPQETVCPPHTPRCHPGPEVEESLEEWPGTPGGYIEFHKKPPSLFQNQGTVMHFQRNESLCCPTSH